MELILVRHGEPDRDAGAGTPGDPGLGERGRRQGQLLGCYLAGERVDALYTSPMHRARETAGLIAVATGNEAVPNDGLVEFDHGAAEYISMSDLRASGSEQYQQVLNGDYSAWGIDVDAFCHDAVVAIENVVSTHPGARVAVVCHGGVINAYLGWVLGLTRFTFFPPYYTSVHRVRCARSAQRTMISLNEVTHLHGHDLLAY